MNTIQLRQTINHYLDQLACARLRLVADFLKFLVHTEHEEQTEILKTSDFRSPSGGLLLSNTETWEGSDVEECLETVYETRSPIKA